MAGVALAGFQITGPKCNLPFFAELLDNPEFLSGDYDTGISATVNLLLKDADCIARHAREANCPTPLFSLAADIHRAAAAQGFGMSDPAVVCRVMEGLAGVERA